MDDVVIAEVLAHSPLNKSHRVLDLSDVVGRQSEILHCIIMNDWVDLHDRGVDAMRDESSCGGANTQPAVIRS